MELAVSGSPPVMASQMGKPVGLLQPVHARQGYFHLRKTYKIYPNVLIIKSNHLSIDSVNIYGCTTSLSISCQSSHAGS